MSKNCPSNKKSKGKPKIPKKSHITHLEIFTRELKNLEDWWQKESQKKKEKKEKEIKFPKIYENGTSSPKKLITLRGIFI